MGCWNETDALTQLPILHGEPVKLFILSHGYEEGEREIQFFPISGKYDDYGCIDNIVEDWHTDFVLLRCNQFLEVGTWKLSERGIQMSKYSGEECVFPYKNIGTLLKAIERDYISASFGNTTSTVSFVLIHDEIYQMALELSEPDCIAVRIGDILQKWSGDRNLAQMLIEFFPMPLRRYAEILFENQEQVTQKAIDMSCLFSFMRANRKRFMEQAGAGSQEDDYLIKARFLKKVYKFAIKKHKERERYETI